MKIRSENEGAAVFLQPAPGAQLVRRADDTPSVISADEVLLRVLASAPSHWDLVAAQSPTRASWPRVPGNVVLALDVEGRRLLATTFQPCAQCTACRAGLHRACTAAHRPGLNVRGGFAQQIVLRRAWLCPEVPDQLGAAEIVGLVALAGTTYQAAAEIGLVGGDTVIVRGALGPGQLPLKLLRSLGSRPIWVTTPDGLDKTSPVEQSEVLITSEFPTPEALPSVRCHILDFYPNNAPAAARIPQGLLAISLSYTAICATDIAGCLAPDRGPITTPVVYRTIADLHPHLVLDLVARLKTKQVEVAPWLECVGNEGLYDAFARWSDQGFAASEPWPVYSESQV